jgi:hypothetical protein
MTDINAERERADEIVSGLQPVPVIITEVDRERAKKIIEANFEKCKKQ